MSFRVDIQSAPIRQGTVGAASAWSGASTTTPTSSGVYRGKLSKTFTFTVVDAGTIGTTATISVDWADGEGNTGRLNLGTDHSYAADDIVTVSDGVSVSFDAAAFSAADTFTIAVTASNRVAGTPVVVPGTLDPVDIAIQNYSRGDNDIVTTTFDGRESRVRRSTTGTVSVRTDYLDDANRDKLLYLHSSRTPVCVGENFDEDTVFLFHGGGLQPFIGDRSSFTRATVATYPDPRTGLLRSAASGEARVVSGKAGRAVLLEAESTNLLTYSAHATPSSVWSVTGANLTLSYDETVRGPYDPEDDYWNAAHRDGVAKLVVGNSVSVGSEFVTTTDVTVFAVTYYSASIWVKGFGTANITLTAGTGSPSSALVQESVQLTSSWQRVQLSAATGAAHNKADIRIFPQEGGVVYFTGWQIEQAATVSALIQTAGSTQTRDLDDQTFSQAIPVEAGTFSLWFYWPETQPTALDYTLFQSTGAASDDDFALKINDNGTGSIYWYTGTTGVAIATLSADLSRGEWHHFVVAWEEDAADGTLVKTMWIDGESVTWLLGGTTTAWVPFMGTGFTLGQGTSSRSEDDTNGFRVEEIRIDSVAWTAADVADQYARLTDDNWLHVHRAHAGRKYRIASISEGWLHPSQPDKIIMDVTLVEMDREDDSVVVPA